MPKVFDIAESVRSKNAGPFWLTIDIFCGKQNSFDLLCKKLTNKTIGNIFCINNEQIQKYEIKSLHVIKFSLPRPCVQGSPNDRDMHGATWAELIYEIDIN